MNAKQLIASALYAVANVCCCAADRLWDDRSFWLREYERLSHAE